MYGSLWFMPAVHMAVGIEAISTPDDIATAIGIDESSARKCLRILQTLGLVQETKGQRWHRIESNIHTAIPSSGAGNQMHVNWRNKAVQSILNAKAGDLFYTSILTAGIKDIPKIQAKFREFCQEIRGMCLASSDEKILAFNADLFHVG